MIKKQLHIRPLTFLCAVFSFVTLFGLTACDDGETYGDMKEKEREAIERFIHNEKIKVISESAFNEQGQTTDTARNEYVYLGKSGVYMQIIRKGEGEKLEENKRVNLLIRYNEYNILDEMMQTRNDYSTRDYDKMSVSRIGSTYTASFVRGVMYSTYGASVPSGWLVPLDYINLGRPTSEEAIAQVKLIVPHTQGQAYAMSGVYACHYTITFEREK